MAKKKQTKEPVVNSLTGLASGLSSTTSWTPMINQQTPAFVNNRWDLVFNNRQLLTELYIEHGLIQTLVDMPVDDAFRHGFEIKSEQIDEDDIKTIMHYIDAENINSKIAQVMKWARLYGGGGLVTMTNQDFTKELNIGKINEFTELDFYAADLWELNMSYYNANPMMKDLNGDQPYMFYGEPVHKSFVAKVKGKEAPSLHRNKFRGWGMTEIERFMRSFNSYLKNTNVIYELLDEAKIDVFKIDGFNNAMISQQGTAAVQNRVQAANQIKNYLNALTMDTKDEYDQKQMQFAGLSDMLQQIRMGVAADLKMPITKLFGVSSAGFNSGEDDIENYNAMVESEVRAKAKHIIIYVVQMVCAKLFGFVPDDIEVEFPPLRVLSSEQEENVKNSKTDRLLRLFEVGLITAEEAQEAINRDNLLGVKVDVTGEATPLFSKDDGMPSDDMTSGSSSLEAKDV